MYNIISDLTSFIYNSSSIESSLLISTSHDCKQMN